MRHRLILSAVTLALSGCVTNENPVSPNSIFPTSTTSMQDSIVYTLSVSQSILARTDTLEAYVTAKNVGQDTNLTFPISCNGMPWSVTNSAGAIVMQQPKSPIQCNSSSRAILAPGQSILLFGMSQTVPDIPSIVGLDTLKVADVSLAIYVN